MSQGHLRRHLRRHPLAAALQRERDATEATAAPTRLVPDGAAAAAATAYILPYRRDLPERERNLRYVVRAARALLGPALDIVVAHQDAQPLVGSMYAWLTREHGCRVVEQPNGGNFDRAWAFNHVVLHHLDAGQRPVCIFGDVDMPLQDNVAALIDDVRAGRLDFASPYHRIHSLSDEGTLRLLRAPLAAGADGLALATNSHGYTFSGGILVAGTAAFPRLGLWYEVGHYGHEDHALDVILERRCAPGRCRVDHRVYLHLWHPRVESDGSREARERDEGDLVQGLLRCTLGHYLHPAQPFTNECGRRHNVNPYFWALYALQRKGDPHKYGEAGAERAAVDGTSGQDQHVRSPRRGPTLGRSPPPPPLPPRACAQEPRPQ